MARTQIHFTYLLSGTVEKVVVVLNFWADFPR